MPRRLSVCLAAASLVAWSFPAGAVDASGIVVLSASYGHPGSARRVDIAARLQDLCGTTGTSCDIWCSQTTFGGRDLGRHALCRAIYRCPDGATRSTEAGREEPILMRCPLPDGDDTGPAATSH
jgi:hypothetical protein